MTAPGSDDPSLGASDRSIRTALRAFIDYLKAFGGSSIVRDIGRTERYRADRYLAVLDDGRKITLWPPFPARLVLSPWPWPDVPPSAFQAGTTSARTLVITPAQYDTLLALPTDYGEGMAVRGPDGRAYLISARPLLPGERLP